MKETRSCSNAHAGSKLLGSRAPPISARVATAGVHQCTPGCTIKILTGSAIRLYKDYYPIQGLLRTDLYYDAGDTNKKDRVTTLILSVNTHWLSSYIMPDTILSAKDPLVKQTTPCTVQRRHTNRKCVIGSPCEL